MKDEILFLLKTYKWKHNYETRDVYFIVYVTNFDAIILTLVAQSENLHCM